jgi:ATP-dependent Clp protease ATP-binding subunit ClpC
MFERFTDRARRVVVLAQEEARMLNHNYIGTEHILLGLVREGQGIACEALESLGVSLEAVRSQVEEIIGQGQAAPTGHIPFTPRAKKVLELSLREALSLGHTYIGTEHILLGVIREGEGVGAQVLQRLGANLNRVRQVVTQLLAGHTGAGEPPEGFERDVPGASFRIPAGPSKELSPRARNSLELAVAVAAWLGHDAVEPTDLLWGLLRVESADVADLLGELGLDLDGAREKIVRLMAESAVAGRVEDQMRSVPSDAAEQAASATGTEEPAETDAPKAPDDPENAGEPEA